MEKIINLVQGLWYIALQMIWRYICVSPYKTLAMMMLCFMLGMWVAQKIERSKRIYVDDTMLSESAIAEMNGVINAKKGRRK